MCLLVGQLKTQAKSFSAVQFADPIVIVSASISSVMVVQDPSVPELILKGPVIQSCPTMGCHFASVQMWVEVRGLVMWYHMEASPQSAAEEQV